MEYRSKIEIDGQVRIVTIPEYDVCACCAPHVKDTGEIGMIKLVNMINYKGGERITMPVSYTHLDVYKRQAYNRVHNVCNLLKNDEVKVYAKRIDSTLRGNLGSETDAMLDCLGEDYVAIVAPCFPSSGRIVIGGYMLVDGIPLHKTNIAIDPKTPVKVSEVEVLFREQSKYQVSSIYMKDLMHGKHYLANLMNDCVKSGSRIITLDCVTPVSYTHLDVYKRQSQKCIVWKDLCILK